MGCSTEIESASPGSQPSALTNMLRAKIIVAIGRVERPYGLYEGPVLPLNYIAMERREGIEPSYQPWQGYSLPLTYQRICYLCFGKFHLQLPFTVRFVTLSPDTVIPRGNPEAAAQRCYLWGGYLILT